MSANSRFTIAVHTLSVLALTDGPASSAYIAGSTGSNPVTIRNMVSTLRNAGLVETIPGSTGGAKLTRKPEDISLAEVYRAAADEPLFDLHQQRQQHQNPFYSIPF